MKYFFKSIMKDQNFNRKIIYIIFNQKTELEQLIDM